jgi:predicted RNase H-like HicB family nuclease
MRVLPHDEVRFFQKVAILLLQEITSMKERLTAVFQQVPEGYIAFVEELPGANSQGDTLEEARANLQEAVQLVLESNRALSEETLRNKVVIREPLASIS